MEEVVERLEEAFEKVATNRGAPGPDRQTVEQVRKHLSTVLRQLATALLDGSYHPGDIRRVWIPKAGGGQRGLGIPNVIDRMVQEAVRSAIEPLYEPTFHPSSHGFRPGRSWQPDREPEPMNVRRFRSTASSGRSPRSHTRAKRADRTEPTASEPCHTASSRPDDGVRPHVDTFSRSPHARRAALWSPAGDRTNLATVQHLAPLLWAALATPLAAQTFIVDAAGGSGANFTTVADAIARVPDGAVLLVRPGTYDPFAVADKSLTILFDSGATVSVQISPTPPVTIRNLAAQRQVTIRGLQVYNILGGVSFGIEDCAGTVLLDACRSDASVGVGGMLQIVRSADVRVHRCHFAPSTVTTCTSTQSHVRISNSSFDGRMWTTQWTDSVVEIAETAISGAGGFARIAPVDLINSSLRVLGGCTLTVNTGALIGGTGTVRIDPTTTLNNGGSQPRFGPGLQVTSRTMPTLRASTDGAGGMATASLRGPAGGIGVLLVGLPTRPTTLPSLEDAILLAPGAAIQAAAGSFASGVSASYAVPLSPALRAVRITWQGASLDAGFGAQVSNAVTYVHW